VPQRPTHTNGLLYAVAMLALGLTLTLLATPEARLVPAEEQLLSPADLQALDRELRVLSGNIQLIKPQVPRGYVVGMALGFSFGVLLLPGIPMVVIGSTSSSFATASLLIIGGALTGLGGVSLVVALMCAVLGTDAESDMAEDLAALVQRRDEIQKRLRPYQRVPEPVQPGTPGYEPGVRLDLPTLRLVTLARF
jgi:hypothetical protein